MPVEAEFGSKTQADAFREEHTEHLAESDDRRLKTVALTDDAPEWVADRAEAGELEGRAETEGGYGQVALTDHERDQIDFSKGRANVPHARSVKAALTKQGVGDWLAHYDPTLTVDEHADDVAEHGKGGGGQRDRDPDDPDVLEEQRRQAAMAAGTECNHAEDHCRHGDPEACEFLGEACGFNEDEIASIMGASEAAPDASTDDLPGPVYNALSGAWTGYKTGVARAEQYGRIINRIRAENDMDPLAFEELGGRVIQP